MDEDFALICSECGTVTIFQIDAPSPRCCARCGSVLSDDVPLAERSHSGGIDEELARFLHGPRPTWLDAGFRRT